MVDEAVVLRLVGREPPVAVGVELDLLQGLAGVLADEVEQHLLDIEGLLGLDLDVGGRSSETAGGLVHHDPRVWQRVALVLGAGAEQELPHRCRQPHADGRDVVGDELHGVVDRHACVDGSAGAVDVEEDVAVGVFRVEQEHLGADRVGVLVLDFGAQEDDALLEQPLIDVVVEPGRAIAAVGLDGRGVVVCHVFDTSGRPRQSHGSLPAVRPQRSASPRPL